MKPKVGMYHYVFRGCGFRIYRYNSVAEKTSSASPVINEPIFYDREEARKRVYELNGWRYNK